MRFLAAIAALALLSTAAQAETLVTPPYPAATPWKTITDKRDDPRFIWIELIPADQSEADIHDILTEQTFYAQKGRDPSEFMRNFFAQTKGACRAVRVNGPTPKTENGFAVAYGQVYCVGAGGKDVDIFAKAISGHDALYVVQREFRRPAEPGATPGMRQFPKGAKDAAAAAMAAQSVADHYLVAQVKLCGDASCASHDSAAAPTQAPADGNDSSVQFGFAPGKTKQAEVEHKLGKPSYQDHRADGEHVDLYRMSDGIVTTFLFGKDNVLIRTAAFRHQ